jgi:hypothetical protein
MARLYKPLLAWLQFLWFLIVLVLRLEQRITWDWYLVFLPIFLLDLAMFSDILTRFIINFTHREAHLLSMSMNKWRQGVYLFYLSAKITFQILLCLKLDAFVNMALYWVLTPLYVMLPVLIGDASMQLFIHS